MNNCFFNLINNKKNEKIKNFKKLFKIKSNLLSLINFRFILLLNNQQSKGIAILALRL